MIEAIILSMICSSSLAYVYFHMLSISKYLDGNNILMKCNEAISDIYYYNLLAETLTVFGLIAYYLLERPFSSIVFFLTEKAEDSFLHIKLA